MATLTLSKMRRTDWIAVGAIVAAVAVLAYLFIGLGVARMRSLNQERLQLARELEDLTRVYETVVSAEALLGRLGEQQQEFARQVPENLDIVGFYGYLTSTAHDAGVLVDRMEPGAVNQTDTYRFLSVQLEARGEFQTLYQFLFQITHLPRLTKVERLQLSATEDPGVCRLELLLNVFAAPQRSAV